MKERDTKSPMRMEREYRPPERYYHIHNKRGHSTEECTKNMNRRMPEVSINEVSSTLNRGNQGTMQMYNPDRRNTSNGYQRP